MAEIVAAKACVVLRPRVVQPRPRAEAPVAAAGRAVSPRASVTLTTVPAEQNGPLLDAAVPDERGRAAPIAAACAAYGLPAGASATRFAKSPFGR